MITVTNRYGNVLQLEKLRDDSEKIIFSIKYSTKDIKNVHYVSSSPEHEEVGVYTVVDLQGGPCLSVGSNLGISVDSEELTGYEITSLIKLHSTADQAEGMSAIAVGVRRTNDSELAGVYMTEKINSDAPKYLDSRAARKTLHILLPKFLPFLVSPIYVLLSKLYPNRHYYVTVSGTNNLRILR